MSIQYARVSLPVLFGGATYASKVLGYSPIAYWPLTETSGTTADNAEGTAARDGTYSGVTLDSADGPAGGRVGLWDGANDYCNIYSASLNAALNRDNGTVVAWCKVSGSGVWSDSTQRRIINLQRFSSTRITMSKEATTGRLAWDWYDGTAASRVQDGNTTTEWFHMAMSWSESGGTVTITPYYDGSALTTLSQSTWTGDLNPNNCNIGATSDAPTGPWDGYLAHVAIFDTPLSADAIADLATV